MAVSVIFTYMRTNIFRQAMTLTKQKGLFLYLLCTNNKLCPDGGCFALNTLIKMSCKNIPFGYFVLKT